VCSERPLILVVDDDADLRESICALIALSGYRTAQAPDGASALKSLREGLLPSLIVLDMHMPVMSGSELMIALAASDALRCLPIVIHSADQPSARMIRNPQVRRYVRKGTTPEAFLRVLEDCRAV
jgi:CheY-like chemotaxis protein